jgi:hypothetical protein
METLVLNDEPLSRASTVGYVYWGCTGHLARYKMHASARVEGRGQVRSQWEYYMMRNIGAYETIRESNNTVAVERKDAETLPDRVKQGAIEQAGPPTPMLSKVTKHLAAAGIRITLEQEALTFKFEEPEDTSVSLVRPVPHPWLPEQTLMSIGQLDDIPGYDQVHEANARLERMLNSKAPAHLIQKTETLLQAYIQLLFDRLLTPDDLRFRSRVMFTGRSVVVPGEEVGQAPLQYDQAGVPNEIAWTIFGPQIIRELGNEEAVTARTEEATETLDRTMADSWILLMRAPVVTPTGMVGFRPVRTLDRAIHVHPFVCDLMNGDFDGDQMALYLPMTAAGQEEAEEKLSLVGHLKRKPELLLSFLPAKDALFGLVLHIFTEEGRQEISQLAGVDIPMPAGYLNRIALHEAMQIVLEKEGAEKTIARPDQLMRRGYEAARTSGASLGAFACSNIDRPTPPIDDDPASWMIYADELVGRIAMKNDYDNPETGMLLLASHSGTRANTQQIMRIVANGSGVSNADGQSVPIRHGYVEGVTPTELFALAHEGLTNIASAYHLNDLGRRFSEANHPQAPHVLSRAMRSSHPGIVFARAAAARESGPLLDVDARFFVGLPVP